eukprot:CAMPEP_0172772302 /NCGR_PEP_ID=MMETSP1074-20121228/192113_1 /TAXON_ID=2916 /ORGANISM="Ceratium fusus, Strain PA161109" /LENGTH=80 /DNA_ID=CAMNT_0013608383 /DNA_START=172 /DNA_END=414 /DNA_ORIENTATION=+
MPPSLLLLLPLLLQHPPQHQPCAGKPAGHTNASQPAQPLVQLVWQYPQAPADDLHVQRLEQQQPPVCRNPSLTPHQATKA